MQSTSPAVKSYLTFDTRDNSYIVGVVVKLELPGVTVKLAGEKQSCKAKVGFSKQCKYVEPMLTALGFVRFKNTI